MKLIGVLRCTGNESSPLECAFQHQGYLGFTYIGFTIVNCSRECRKDRYGLGSCDQECMCISANTEDCVDVSGECTCISGWTGTHCETDINECLSTNTCPDGMDCVDQSGSWCSGANTECRNIDGGFKCDCVEGYARDNSDTCLTFTASSNTLLIVILSSVVGVLLIIVFVGIWCVRRNRQNGIPSTSASELQTTQSMKDAVKSSTACENCSESSYCTINDAGNYDLLQKLPASALDYKTLQCNEVDSDGYL